MKTIKHILAACAAFVLLSSCSLLGGAGSSQNGTATGTTTGQSLYNLYNVVKATGTVDVSKIDNLVNVAAVLTGATTLQNATQNYLNQFSSGLISGSSNLVNTNNVSNVITGLAGLNNLDTSAITQAAAIAAANAAAKSAASQAATVPAASQQQLNTSSQNVTSTVSAITGLLGLLGGK